MGPGTSSTTAGRIRVARDSLEEIKKGLDKWFKLVFYVGCIWILLDILPHLPDELAIRIIDKLLSTIGL